MRAPASYRPLIVRRATPGDAFSVIRFNLLLAESLGRTGDRRRLVSGVQTFLADPSLGTYFLALSETDPLGQVQVVPLWDDWQDGVVWWADGLSVTTQKRRFGTAGALVRHVLVAADADPRVTFVRCELPHDAENYEPFRYFYERLAFRRSGVVMERPAAHDANPTAVCHAG